MRDARDLHFTLNTATNISQDDDDDNDDSDTNRQNGQWMDEWGGRVP